MAPRLILIAAVVWTAGLLVFAAGLRWTGTPRHPPRPPATSNLARSLNGPTPTDNWQWSVTSARSSQGALVVEADVIAIEDSGASARAIVEPLRERYREILVYLRQVDSPSPTAAMRFQWTPERGYVPLVLATQPWNPKALPATGGADSIPACITPCD